MTSSASSSDGSDRARHGPPERLSFAAKGRRPAASAMMHARRILLADDDPNDVALILRALRRLTLNERVDVVRDGVDALDYLHGRGAHAGRAGCLPALAVLDVKMPRLGGLEVLADLRGNERLRRLPVVMLSSSREACDIAQSYALGTNAYVVKPTDFREFTLAVERIFDFWARANEPPAA